MQHIQINILRQSPTPNEWRFMVHLASRSTFYIIVIVCLLYTSDAADEHRDV